jgi:hypothetical protein
VSDVEIWLNDLRTIGRSENTCRTYMSVIKQDAGIEIELPKRTKHEKRELTNADLKAMLTVTPESQYALVASLILCGPAVLDWTWRMVAELDPDLPYEARLVLISEASRRGNDVAALISGHTQAHFVNGVDLDAIIFPLDQHGINRRLKAIASIAGIGDNDINVTTIRGAHARLEREYKDIDRAAVALEIDFRTNLFPYGRTTRRLIKPSQKAEPRLHGMGRRGSSVMKIA